MKFVLGALVLVLATMVMGQDTELVRVNCIPVREGTRRCLCNYTMPQQPLFDTRNISEPLKCQIALHTGAYLPNDCSVMLSDPTLTQCTATLPKSVLHLAYYQLVAGLLIIRVKAIASPEHTSCFERMECGVMNQNLECVVNECCRLCLRDYRAFIGEQIDPEDCLKGCQ